MSELNYVPSWLDSAMTLLEKLNKCIEKIETIVNTVVSVTKTANDALSLANTNESDITTIQGNITAIQGDITRLDNNNNSTRELTDQALSTANRAETKADEALAKSNTNATNITALQNEKSGKLYLHKITLSPVVAGGYRFTFWAINEESNSYKTKFNSEEAFTTTIYPFNCILTKRNNEFITKSLALQLTEIAFAHIKSGNAWNTQNCNGSINFAAYLDDSNQIVTITDYPEWYAATVDDDYVIEL